MIRSLYFIEFLRRSIFQNAQFLKLKLLQALLHGKVYCGLDI